MTFGTPSLLNTIAYVWMGVAAFTFVALFWVTAPYGRHNRRGWGLTMPSHLGWLVMEAPSALLFAASFLAGGGTRPATAWALAALWEAHYIHRAFIYPWQLRDQNKRMPIAVAAMAAFFNLVNAPLNGFSLALHQGQYGASWLLDPRFILGALLFVGGFALNRQSDSILRGLRAPGETAYRIPRGGAYRWVSCPNYLGEIVEWLGWALATWSLAGLTFAVWTIANLAPRARANHRWYRATFPDYPPERRALIPWLW